MGTLTRFNTSLQSRGSNLDISRDKNLQDTMARLKASKTELEGINKFLKKALNLPTDRTRSLVAKVLHRLIPQVVYSHLPDGLVKFVAEEYDILELIERLMRMNINNTQDALRNLAIMAMCQKDQIDEALADIQKAKAENWDAQKLHEYMADKANIQIYAEIERLLDSEFGFLPGDERERRKVELLEQLEANIVVGKELGMAIARTCSAGLAILHRAVGQFYDYVNVYRPLSVIRDSAMTLVDMNQSMYASKAAVVQTFESSIHAIEEAVQAASLINQYSIASTNMCQRIAVGTKRLETGLLKLQQGREKIKLLPILDSKPAEKTAEVS